VAKPYNSRVAIGVRDNAGGSMGGHAGHRLSVPYLDCQYRPSGLPLLRQSRSRVPDQRPAARTCEGAFQAPDLNGKYRFWPPFIAVHRYSGSSKLVCRCLSHADSRLQARRFHHAWLSSATTGGLHLLVSDGVFTFDHLSGSRRSSVVSPESKRVV
jgi:hypothetical protein